jgi:hypothetical protein
LPLANTWRSEASSWDDEQRERYANDSDVLLCVEDNANREKGDKGPEAWKPANEAEWCDYAGRWFNIKTRYELGVSEREKEVLEQRNNTVVVHHCSKLPQIRALFESGCGECSPRWVLH